MAFLWLWWRLFKPKYEIIFASLSDGFDHMTETSRWISQAMLSQAIDLTKKILPKVYLCTGMYPCKVNTNTVHVSLAKLTVSWKVCTYVRFICTSCQQILINCKGINLKTMHISFLVGGLIVLHWVVLFEITDLRSSNAYHTT